jgi:hypothetical protein
MDSSLPNPLPIPRGEGEATARILSTLNKLVAHKAALFSFLQERWKDLFGIRYEVLLYDLTSTYFESNPPFAEGDKRQFGYSRDKRSDCVQVVIALVVTPEGFPMAYEVLPGNTSDKTTLKDFLERIQKQYGKARRVWVMDRGIPTDEVLEEMRQQTDPPLQYVVGTPKGRLGKLEAQLVKLSWQQARPSVQVKLLSQEEELFVLVQSQARVSKERAMRRRKLKQLWTRLKALREQRPSYETLLMKLGAAKAEAGRVWSLVEVALPEAPRSKKARQQRVSGFEFGLQKKKLREVFKREGRYLLRTNLKETDPAKVWEFYLQLVEVEEAFKNLKGDLAIRPIFHQLERRIEAHVFVCFLAYCLQVSLRHQLRAKAPGLTVRQVLEKFGRMQMMDVHFPTTDGRGHSVRALHPTRKGSSTDTGTDELGTAATIAAPDHGERRVGNWLQTFAKPSLILRHFNGSGPGDWGRFIGGSLAYIWRTPSRPLSSTYPTPIRHLSNTYPTPIRQTVNTWNWGTCGHRGEATLGGRQKEECRMTGQATPGSIKATPRLHQSQPKANYMQVTSRIRIS